MWFVPHHILHILQRQGSDQVNAVLIIAPSWVGDMVMAQSLFKVLKAQDSERAIDVLAPGWTRVLLERMPEVREAIDMPLGHGRAAAMAAE